jgi:hypothetical protein
MTSKEEFEKLFAEGGGVVYGSPQPPIGSCQGSTTASGTNAKDIMKSIQEVQQKYGPSPLSRAYLCVPPEMFDQIPITPIQFEEEPYQMKFRSFMDFGIPVIRMPSPIFTTGDYSPSEKKVEWKVEEVKTPITLIQLCIIIGFLTFLLISISSLFGKI